TFPGRRSATDAEIAEARSAASSIHLMSQGGATPAQIARLKRLPVDAVETILKEPAPTGAQGSTPPLPGPAPQVVLTDDDRKKIADELARVSLPRTRDDPEDDLEPKWTRNKP